MSKKIDQINELLRAELARLIIQELDLPEAMITISHVDCSPDLRYAKVSVSILPEKYTGTALAKLRKHANVFSNILIKKTRLRKIPKLDWRVDNTEVKAAEIEKVLKKIAEEE